MYLTRLAELIEEAINTSLPESWGGGVVVPVDMPVFAGFDPFFNSSETTDPGIYIIPGYVEYDLSSSRKGVGVRSIMRMSVTICKPFEAPLDLQESSGDVTVGSEWSLLSNLREDLERFLIHCSIPGVKLEEIEPEPPDELALDNRLYLAPTALGYRSC